MRLRRCIADKMYATGPTAEYLLKAGCSSAKKVVSFRALSQVATQTQGMFALPLTGDGCLPNFMRISSSLAGGSDAQPMAVASEHLSRQTARRAKQAAVLYNAN